MAGKWYNERTEIKEKKKGERHGLSRARRHRIIMRVLFIYLIIDILVDFKLIQWNHNGEVQDNYAQKVKKEKTIKDIIENSRWKGDESQDEPRYKGKFWDDTTQTFKTWEELQQGKE